MSTIYFTCAVGHSCGVRVLMTIEYMAGGYNLPNAGSWTTDDIEIARLRYCEMMHSGRIMISLGHINHGSDFVPPYIPSSKFPDLTGKQKKSTLPLIR